MVRRRNLLDLICFRNLIRSRALTNRFLLLQKDLCSLMRAKHVLNYRVILFVLYSPLLHKRDNVIVKPCQEGPSRPSQRRRNRPVKYDEGETSQEETSDEEERPR